MTVKRILVLTFLMLGTVAMGGCFAMAESAGVEDIRCSMARYHLWELCTPDSLAELAFISCVQEFSEEKADCLNSLTTCDTYTCDVRPGVFYLCDDGTEASCLPPLHCVTTGLPGQQKACGACLSDTDCPDGRTCAQGSVCVE